MPFIRTVARSPNVKALQYRLRRASSIVVPTTAPIFINEGTSSQGSTSATPGLPTATVGRDLLLLVAETSGDQTPTLPTGFRHVEGSPLTTVADATGSKLTVAYLFRGSTVSTTAISGVTDHIVAQIWVFRGALDRYGGPRVISSVANTTPSTTYTWGNGSVQPNSLIFLIVGDEEDNATGTRWTNTLTSAGNLTGVGNTVEARTSLGNGGGFSVWQASCNSSTIGTVTATAAASRTSCGFAIALEPRQLIKR